MKKNWSRPETVAGFAQSPPNDTLVRFAEAELPRAVHGLALDIGCGAARNAAPLAEAGWRVVGLDDSWPMLGAAAVRASGERVWFAQATMEDLPVASGTMDLVIAHGIWNLAGSSDQFRRAVREAARVARPGAALFLFTFSRHTLPESAVPVAGEDFVFTDFAGEPQCFLTREQVIAELAAAGFHPDPAVPLTELNRPAAPVRAVGGPVIWQAGFRKALS